MILLNFMGVRQADCNNVDSGRLNRWARYRQKTERKSASDVKERILRSVGVDRQEEGHKLRPRCVLGVENNQRIDCPLAVVELIPGRDGEVRLMKLKTASRVVLRPIQRDHPFEMHR